MKTKKRMYRRDDMFWSFLVWVILRINCRFQMIESGEKDWFRAPPTLSSAVTFDDRLYAAVTL